jgi:hypothetical protein
MLVFLRIMEYKNISTFLFFKMKQLILKKISISEIKGLNFFIHSFDSAKLTQKNPKG